MLGKRVDAAVERMQQGPVGLAQSVDQSACGDEGLHDRPQLGGVKTSAARGACDDRRDVARTADADIGPFRQQPACFVGLIEPPSDDDPVGRRFDGRGQAARWLECGVGQRGARG